MRGSVPFRLAAVDIDDTLLGPDGRISPENAAAIAALRARGTRVVLASGRSHANMMRFHEALELGAGPVISNHGAVVRETTEETPWFAHALPPAAAVRATRDGLERGMSLIHYRSDAVYLQAHTPWTERNQGRAPTPHLFVDDLLWTGGEGILKVMWLESPEVIASVAAGTRERYAGELSVIETDPGYLEFTAPGVNKAIALEHVAEHLGIDRSEVLAFGDGNNDAGMLEWAGLGVAMDHARPSAKEAADLIAPEGNPECSLARAIELVLETRYGPAHRAPAGAR